MRIPAWAGEPQRLVLRSRVYPRVGGGTGGLPASAPGRAAVYPRVGGGTRAVHEGIMRGVYPRVGGGTRFQLGAGLRAQGLSPRGRGNPSLAIVDGGTSLSPRGRGNRLWYIIRGWIKRGLSPRGRGNPVLMAKAARRAAPVYPRVGGGTCTPCAS